MIGLMEPPWDRPNEANRLEVIWQYHPEVPASGHFGLGGRRLFDVI